LRGDESVVEVVEEGEEEQQLMMKKRRMKEGEGEWTPCLKEFHKASEELGEGVELESLQHQPRL
jgi:hypothetical protein